MDFFRYSPTLETLKKTGRLKDNYQGVNWKLIKSEIIVSHNMNNIKMSLEDYLKTIKTDILLYCGNPEGLEEILDNVL